MKSKKEKSGMNSNVTSSKRLPRIKARGRYNIVDGSSDMIEQSSAENKTEDEVLTPYRRARLLDLTRNLVRNSSLFNTILG